METKAKPDPVKKKKLMNRLSRVSGQVQAIRRMVEDDAECITIAQQLSAARTALDKAYFEMMACAMEVAVKDGVAQGEALEPILEEMTGSLVKYA